MNHAISIRSREVCSRLLNLTRPKVYSDKNLFVIPYGIHPF